MGRPADIYNAMRRRLWPGIHSLLDVGVGGYALSDTPPEEYVCTLQCTEPEVEQMLRELGFSRNIFASLKVRVDGNVSDGSWVYRESVLADHQLHVILHQTDAGVETYAHWEYSSIRHPYRHYLARDYRADKGVRIMRRVFREATDGHDVLTIEAPHQRHTWYISLLRWISDTLAGTVVDVRERYDEGLTEETPGVAQRAFALRPDLP